ncbi:MAG TPA: hypothetical protein VND64_22355 [Pirellulales bacterium]|nr:hypothetical protein [Pirellulales bacterium]
MDTDLLCVVFAFNLTIGTLVGGVIGLYVKGRTNDGAILGFLFGVIGWLIIPFLADRRRHCPQCRMAVPYDAVKCRACQSDISSTAGVTLAKKPVMRVGFVVLALALVVLAGLFVVIDIAVFGD